jgi:hypothetical protein
MSLGKWRGEETMFKDALYLLDIELFDVCWQFFEMLFMVKPDARLFQKFHKKFDLLNRFDDCSAVNFLRLVETSDVTCPETKRTSVNQEKLPRKLLLEKCRFEKCNGGVIEPLGKYLYDPRYLKFFNSPNKYCSSTRFKISDLCRNEGKKLCNDYDNEFLRDVAESVDYLQCDRFATVRFEGDDLDRNKYERLQRDYEFLWDVVESVDYFKSKRLAEEGGGNSNPHVCPVLSCGALEENRPFSGDFFQFLPVCRLNRRLVPDPLKCLPAGYFSSPHPTPRKIPRESFEFRRLRVPFILKREVGCFLSRLIDKHVEVFSDALVKKFPEAIWYVIRRGRLFFEEFSRLDWFLLYLRCHMVSRRFYATSHCEKYVIFSSFRAPRAKTPEMKRKYEEWRRSRLVEEVEKKDVFQKKREWQEKVNCSMTTSAEFVEATSYFIDSLSVDEWKNVLEEWTLDFLKSEPNVFEDLLAWSFEDNSLLRLQA